MSYCFHPLKRNPLGQIVKNFLTSTLSLSLNVLWVLLIKEIEGLILVPCYQCVHMYVCMCVCVCIIIVMMVVCIYLLFVQLWRLIPFVPSEVAQSCVTLCDPMDTRLLRPWDFLGKSTGVGCHFLLQGIFPTQGSNPGLLYCRQTFYHLSHQRSPDDDAINLQRGTQGVCPFYLICPVNSTLNGLWQLVNVS